MLKQNTVLVLGAGASAEIGMPIGLGLADNIAKNFYFEFDLVGYEKGDRRILSILRRKFSDSEVLNCHLKACRRIHDGVRLRRSIDDYIYANKSDSECNFLAKLGITEAILRAERSSKLFSKRYSGEESKSSNLDGSWYDEFATIAFQGVAETELKAALEKFRVISFNYDRCFQQALAIWIERVYGLSFDEACEYVSLIEIVHPYGSVGKICGCNSTDGLLYGGEPHENEVVGLAKNIRTYSEQIEDHDFLKKIKDIYAFADVVFYLGSAYHPQNLKLLDAPQSSYDKFIAGTALGISEDELDIIGERLAAGMFMLNGFKDHKELFLGLKEKQIRLHKDMNCLQILKSYRRRITAYE